VGPDSDELAARAGDARQRADLRRVVAGEDLPRHARRAKVLGWPKRRKLAHAFLWEYSYKRLNLAQLLGQRGVILTRFFKLAQQFPWKSRLESESQPEVCGQPCKL
jgi:hypothetical protein